jgi:hypothetical protein
MLVLKEDWTSFLHFLDVDECLVDVLTSGLTLCQPEDPCVLLIEGELPEQ